MEPLHSDDPGKIGGYKLLKRLGAGGMGVVYYAKRGGQRVALKVIRQPFAGKEEYRKRFEHEIRNARKVNSPYVAKIIEYNTKGAVWWYASEYVPGLTVEEAVQRNGGRLASKTVRKLIFELALALRDIHAAGIVHRDLKPQNVIINAYGAKVIDFGIAFSDGATQLTATGLAMGTPAFMCPDHMAARKPNYRWDMFALGGMIIYASSGYLPFFVPGEDKGPHDVMMRILRGEEPYLGNVPQEFHELIKLCMEGSITADQVASYMPVAPQSEPQQTLFLTSYLKTSIKEWPRVHAMKPVPRPRYTGESNESWRRRNQTYIAEMASWEKAERQRRKHARKSKRMIPLSVKFVAAAALGGVVYLYSAQELPQWLEDIKEKLPADIAEAVPSLPHTPDKNESESSSPPYVQLPGAPFSPVTKSGKTNDPDNPGSFVEVTGVQHKDYQMTVSVNVSDFANHGDAPFAESCVRVNNGRSTVTVYPTKYEADDALNGVTPGILVFSTAFNGTYKFYAECNLDTEIKSVPLGTLNKGNVGTVSDKDIVVPVMGTRMNGKDLVVSVIPDDHGSTQFCLRGKSITLRPAAINKTQVGDIKFTELTFKNINKGVLYPSCSEKKGRVTVHGGGAKVGF